MQNHRFANLVLLSFQILWPLPIGKKSVFTRLMHHDTLGPGPVTPHHFFYTGLFVLEGRATNQFVGSIGISVLSLWPHAKSSASLLIMLAIGPKRTLKDFKSALLTIPQLLVLCVRTEKSVCECWRSLDATPLERVELWTPAHGRVCMCHQNGISL